MKEEKAKGRLRLEDLELEASLGYLARPVSKKKQNKTPEGLCVKDELYAGEKKEDKICSLVFKNS
jgi:hypothetical protein